MTWPSHGSNPAYLYKAMGMQVPRNLIDLSANINPLGPPESLREKWNEWFLRISDYPDPLANRLREAIAVKENIHKDSILIGNGGAELITLLAHTLSGKRVLIVQPTFSEYEQACMANHCEVRYFQLEEPTWELNIEKLLPYIQNSDAIFLCNPTNPTGIQYSTNTILKLVTECEKTGCYVILDEAFHDFLENEESSISYIEDFPNLLILRSMTKMFAIPGLRLGFVAGNPALIYSLSKFQSHWSVNTLALLAGEECVKNEHFCKVSRQYITKEKNKLHRFFERGKFIASASQVNFYLLRDPILGDQFPLFHYLLERGIVPRHTMNFPGLGGRWLRFAIKSEADNDRLTEVLMEWREHHR